MALASSGLRAPAPGPHTPVGVAVIAGHPIIRGVVRLACEEASDLDLVVELDRIEGASERIRELEPDVTLIDQDLPDGLGLLRELRGAGYQGRVLMMTDRTGGAAVLEALRRGADGYLVKAEELRSIASAIRRTAAGERLVTPSAEHAALGQVRRFATHARQSVEIATTLTTRERDVLLHLAEGLTVRRIGRVLGISPRTVEKHVARLYRKLGVRSRVQAIARATALDLIDLR